MEISFCSSNGPSEDGFLNPCIVDIVYFLPHVLFMTIMFLCLFIKWLHSRKTKRKDEQPSKQWVRYPGHSLRWILTFALIYAQILEATEGVLSELKYQGIHLHLYIPHLGAVFGAICSLIFYNVCENHNVPQFLIVSFLYWTITLVAKVIRMLSLLDNGLESHNARIILSWISLSIVALLVLIEIYVMKSEVRNIVKIY